MGGAGGSHLARSQVFVFPAVGHGVLDSHVCAADLVRGFFADPDLAKGTRTVWSPVGGIFCAVPASMHPG